jgi:serine/threonine protein kinase
MKTRKHRSSQKAGTIYVKRTPDDNIDNSIYQILKHATAIEVLGASSLYGLNLKITIPEEKSRLIGSSLHNLGRPITQFIVKIVVSYLIEGRGLGLYWNTSNTEYNPKKCSLETDIIKEITAQQDIFVKSSYLGNPICPAIVTGGIFANTHFRGESPQHTFTKLHRELVKMATRLNNQDFINILERIHNAVINQQLYIEHQRRPDIPRKYDVLPTERIGIGLICMEFLDGYKTLYESLNDIEAIYGSDSFDRQYTLYGQAVYILARLITIGYFHSDIHQKNIMYNATTRHMMFIDFGRTLRIRQLDNAHPQNPVQQYFLTLMNHYQFGNYPETDPRIKIDILYRICQEIMTKYRERITDPWYSGPNRLLNENIFYNYQIVNRNITLVHQHFTDIFNEREAHIRALVNNGDLNHLVHLKSLKNEVFDVFGYLRGLKIKAPVHNIEMDFELMMFLREYATRAEVIGNPRAMRKLNNTALPRIYKQRLEPIKTQVEAKRTRRLRRRR